MDSRTWRGPSSRVSAMLSCLSFFKSCPTPPLPVAQQRERAGSWHTHFFVFLHKGSVNHQGNIEVALCSGKRGLIETHVQWRYEFKIDERAGKQIYELIATKKWNEKRANSAGGPETTSDRTSLNAVQCVFSIRPGQIWGLEIKVLDEKYEKE